MAYPDSLVRLRQLSNPEVSGYVVEIISKYLTTGVVTGTGIMASNTGVLTGAFYPLRTNPSGYVIEDQITGLATKEEVTGNNTTILVTVANLYYLKSNPSGFVTLTQLNALSLGVTGYSVTGSSSVTGVLNITTGSGISATLSGKTVSLGLNPHSFVEISGIGGTLVIDSGGFLLISGATPIEPNAVVYKNMTGSSFYPRTGNPSGYISTGAADIRYGLISYNVRTTGDQVISGFKDFKHSFTQFKGVNTQTLSATSDTSLQVVDVNQLLTAWDGVDMKVTPMSHLDYISDTNDVRTVDITNRNLADLTGGMSIDFRLGQLHTTGVGNAVTVNYSSGILLRTGQKSVDWYDRALYNSTGGLALSWESGIFKDRTGNHSINWNNRTLSGQWNADRLGVNNNFSVSGDLTIGGVFSGDFTVTDKLGYQRLVIKTGVSNSMILRDAENHLRMSIEPNVSFGAMNFYDVAGVTRMAINPTAFDMWDWNAVPFINNRYLMDQWAAPSVDWNNRKLYNNLGNPMIDWWNLYIVGSTSYGGSDYPLVPTLPNIMRWDEGVLERRWKLKDPNSVSVLDAAARVLIDGTGRVLLDWGTLTSSGVSNRAAHLRDYANKIAMYWPLRQGIGTSGYEVTIDWGNRLLSGDWLIVNDGVTGSLRSGGITTGQTGAFYPYANPLKFLSGIQVSPAFPIDISGATDIGMFSSLHGPHDIGVSVLFGDSNISLSKHYQISTYYNGITTWKKVIPLTTAGSFNGQDFDLDASTTGTLDELRLRLRRTLGSVVGTPKITLINYGAGANDVFTPTIATGFVAVPTESISFDGLSSVYYPLLGNPSGFVMSSQTGTFVTQGQTGAFITTGQTGAFVTTGQTGAFVTTGQTGAFVTTGQTGAFVTTGQTGAFYPYANPLKFISGTQLNLPYPSAVSGAVQIGTFQNTFGAHDIGVSVMLSDAGNSVAKHYQITTNWGGLLTWKRVLPLASSGPYTTQDFELDASGATDTLSLRLRRSSGTTIAFPKVTLVNYGAQHNDLFITGGNVTGFVAIPTENISFDGLSPIYYPRSSNPSGFATGYSITDDLWSSQTDSINQYNWSGIYSKMSTGSFTALIGGFGWSEFDPGPCRGPVDDIISQYPRKGYVSLWGADWTAYASGNAIRDRQYSLNDWFPYEYRITGANGGAYTVGYYNADIFSFYYVANTGCGHFSVFMGPDASFSTKTPVAGLQNVDAGDTTSGVARRVVFTTGTEIPPFMYVSGHADTTGTPIRFLTFGSERSTVTGYRLGGYTNNGSPWQYVASTGGTRDAYRRVVFTGWDADIMFMQCVDTVNLPENPGLYRSQMSGFINQVRTFMPNCHMIMGGTPMKSGSAWNYATTMANSIQRSVMASYSQAYFDVTNIFLDSTTQQLRGDLDYVDAAHLTTSGFARFQEYYRDWVDILNVNRASVLKTQTGILLASKTFVNTGYYPRSNPSGYLTAGTIGGVNTINVTGGLLSGALTFTGISGVMITTAIGSPNTIQFSGVNTGSLVAANQTGILVGKNESGLFVGDHETGAYLNTFVRNDQSGSSFYPKTGNPSGYLTGLNEFTGILVGKNETGILVGKNESGLFVGDHETGAYLNTFVRNDQSGSSFYPRSGNPSGYLTGLNNLTGILVGKNETGAYTNAFYPLNSNPAGYTTVAGGVTGYSVTGSSFVTGALNITTGSGISATLSGQTVSLGLNPNSFAELTGAGNVVVSTSGNFLFISGSSGNSTLVSHNQTGSSFYPRSGNPSGYLTGLNNLTGILVGKNETGILVGKNESGLFVGDHETGAYLDTFVRNDQSGSSFYPRSGNPSGYLTGLNNLTGILVGTNQTGILVGKNESGLFVGDHETGAYLNTFVRNDQSGSSFYPRSGNPSGYITAAQAGGIPSITVTGFAGTGNTISGALIFSGLGGVVVSTGLSSGTSGNMMIIFSGNSTGGLVASNQTGILVGIHQTGAYLNTFVRNDQSGSSFYPRSGNPSGYLTGLNNLTGILVGTNQTGAFYPYSNPLKFISGIQASLTLPIDISGATDIGSFDAIDGAHDIGISVLIADSNFSVSKHYQVNTNYGYPTTWKKIIPLTYSSPVGAQDFDLDVSGLTTVLSLRLRRTAGNVIGYPLVTLVNYGAGIGDVFTPSSVTGFVAVPTESMSFDDLSTIYYPRSSNPSGYLTAGTIGGVNTINVTGGLLSGALILTGVSGVTITTVIGSPNTIQFSGVNTGSLVATNQTGILVGKNESGLFVGDHETGAYLNTFVRNDQSGSSFYPRSGNPSGYLTSANAAGIPYIHVTGFAGTGNRVSGGLIFSGLGGVVVSTGLSSGTSGEMMIIFSGNSTGGLVASNQTGILVGIHQTGAYLNTFVRNDQSGSSFYPKTGNPSGYLTGLNNLTGILVGKNESGAYRDTFVRFDQTGSSFYPRTGNPSGYLTSADAAGVSNINVSGHLLSGSVQFSGIGGLNVITGRAGVIWFSGGAGGGGVSSITASGNALVGAISMTGLNTVVYPSGQTIVVDAIVPSRSFNTLINWTSGNVFFTTLTGNVDFRFTGERDGQTIVIKVANSGTGNWNVSWPSGGTTGVRWSTLSGVSPRQTSGSRPDIYTLIRIDTGIYASAIQGFS
jgi:hypothetical protein